MTPAEHTIDRQRLMIRALEQTVARFEREIAALTEVGNGSKMAARLALAKAAPLLRAIGRL